MTSAWLLNNIEYKRKEHRLDLLRFTDTVTVFIAHSEGVKMPLFTHPINNVSRAYKSLADYCTSPPSVVKLNHLRQSISNLTVNELTSVNEMGETLLFSAIALSHQFSAEQCSKAMSVLFEYAERVDPTGYAREVLFVTKNSQGVSPLQLVLETESFHAGNDFFSVVGPVFFYQLHDWLSYSNTTKNYLDILNISGQTLYIAFMHSNILYLKCIHMALADHNFALAYKAIFFESRHGARLFDKLILGSSVTILANFFDELRSMKHCGLINHDEHVNLLTQHPKFAEGFSPFHELVLTNDFKKIALYVRELNTILTPKVFAHHLLKKNQKQYTVLHQGINNGTMDSGASIELARFFISLLDPIYFPIETCLHLIRGDFENRALKCIPIKKNGLFINELIVEHKNNLLMRLPATYQVPPLAPDLSSQYFFSGVKQEQHGLPSCENAFKWR